MSTQMLVLAATAVLVSALAWLAFHPIGARHRKPPPGIPATPEAIPPRIPLVPASEPGGCHLTEEEWLAWWHLEAALRQTQSEGEKQ